MAVTNERTIIIRLDTRGNARGLVETGRSVERLARGVDSLGSEMRHTTSDADGLNAELRTTNDRIRELHTQIARTRDMSLFGDLGREERNARRLQKVLTSIAPDAGGKAGRSFAESFVANIGQLPSKLRGTLIVGIVGLAVAAAPSIGAVVAGAVVGAVGIGGIAGGIAMASKDRRVREAAKAFAGDISREFFSGGGAFVEPTVQALNTLRVGFHEMNLGESFAKAAPFVDEFAEGVAGLGREFMPGFTRAMIAAGPALELFGEELPQIGEAFGTMIAQISESEGAMGGLQALLDGVAGTLRVTGDAVDYLSARFRDSVDVGARIGTFASTVWGWVPVLGDHFQNTTAHFEDWQRSMDGVQLHIEGNVSGFRRIGGEIGKVSPLTMQLAVDEKELAAAAKEVEKSQKAAADAIRDYNRAIDDAISTAANLDRSQDAFKLGMLDLNQSIKDNGKVWGDNTRAGLANRAALAQVIGTIDDIRKAQIASGIDAQTANAAYNAQLETIKKWGIAAGLTRQQLEDLIGDYFINLTLTYKTKGRRFVLPSGDYRVSGGGRLLETEVTFTASSTPPRAIPRQHGGPAEPHRSYLVGEAGPELLHMGSQRGHVTPNAAMDWSTGLDYDRLARALASAVEGMMVTLDGMTVGRVIDGRIALHDRAVARRVG